MKTMRKILLAVVLTLAVAAVMSVCIMAFDIETDLPVGVTNTDERWVDSGFSDVDDVEGWYLMSGTDYSTTTTSFPTFAALAGARFYWHKETNSAVWLVTASSMTGNYGEDGVVSLADLSDANRKKFYAYASCFVDVTNTTNNAFKTHFATSSVDKAQYVTQSTKYPIYSAYITAGKASKQWSNVNVTKAAYDAYIAYKAELGYAEDENVTDTAHQDLLVEHAFTNIAPYKNLINCKENGAKYNMAWVFAELAANNLPFAKVEFRVNAGLTPIFNTVGLVLSKLDAETILFDENITKLSLTNTFRSLFAGNAALKTFTHVSYNEDRSGEYTGDVVENVVDLSGFDAVVPYSAGVVTQLLYSNPGLKKVIWFSTLMDGDTNYAGYFDTQVLQGATSLEEVVIPASVTLTAIKASAFNGCKALKVIDVRGAVSEDFAIESATAFSGVSDLTIKVYSELDKQYMEAALAKVNVEATVETTKVEDSDDDQGVAIPNVITADGFMLRTNTYNGLRALFTFDEDKASSIAAETGYSLVEYGALASSATSYKAAGSPEDLLAQANGKSIQRIVIFADDDTGLNRYVDVDAKQYCIAVRDFEGENVLKEIYVAGYAIWSNGTETVITFSEYTTKAGKNTLSLYTLTLEMYKAGAINAQTVTDSVCLWDVLSEGALSVTEAETQAPSTLLTLTQGYEYDADGKFTYVDLPLRAWNMYRNSSGNTVWNSRGTSVEETATTGVLWSILVDGSNYVVVYRADPSAETSTIPTLSAQYGASAPYSSSYFKVTADSQVTEDATANGLLKTATIYSPILSAENSKKVATIVVDYGVDTFGSRCFDDYDKASAVSTIIYPEGVTAGNYLLGGCYAVADFVYATVNKTYLDEYDVESLVDFSGLEMISLCGLVQNAVAIQNVLLPESGSIKHADQYGFGGASSLSRVWTVGADMPEAGVMDLTNTKIKSICKGFFNNLNGIDTVLMPETFVSISSYSMATTGQTTDTARWHIFGDNSSETKLNIHVGNWNALNVIANTFYEARQNIAYNDNKEGDPNGIAHIVDYLQITYEDVTKTVLEWRADFPAQPAE